MKTTMQRVYDFLADLTDLGVLDDISGRSDLTHPDAINSLCDAVQAEVRSELAGLRVSLDGGASYAAASDGVRVIRDSEFYVGEHECVALHINLTSEGLIIDLCTAQGVVATSCQLYDDIIADLLVNH